MKKVLIATIDGMIKKEDTKELEKITNIDWIIKDKIGDVKSDLSSISPLNMPLVAAINGFNHRELKVQYNI